jgi:hypothetical protein
MSNMTALKIYHNQHKDDDFSLIQINRLVNQSIKIQINKIQINKIHKIHTIHTIYKIHKIYKKFLIFSFKKRYLVETPLLIHSISTFTIN